MHDVGSSFGCGAGIVQGWGPWSFCYLCRGGADAGAGQTCIGTRHWDGSHSRQLQLSSEGVPRKLSFVIKLVETSGADGMGQHCSPLSPAGFTPLYTLASKQLHRADGPLHKEVYLSKANTYVESQSKNKDKTQRSHGCPERLSDPHCSLSGLKDPKVISGQKRRLMHQGHRSA